MQILRAETGDTSELYKLQLIAFESEAEMIGCRLVPALLETKEKNEKDFFNWTVLKTVNEKNEIENSDKDLNENSNEELNDTKEDNN